MKNQTAGSRLVIKFQDGLNIPYEPDSEFRKYIQRRPDFEWRKFQEAFPGITIKNLFSSISPERIRDLMHKACESDPGYQAPDLLSYFAIDCPAGIRTRKLLGMLSNCKLIERAYPETDICRPPAQLRKHIVCGGQEYLNPAPEGIDAKYAWGIPGGDGTGNVLFIDIEKGWILDHEALNVNVFPDTGLNRYGYADHGAAVLGIVMMHANDTGAIGITPMVKGSVVSQYRPDGTLNTADAIMTAIDRLGFGDILLLEAQVSDSGGENLWPVEIQDAIYDVIRLATALNIVVIEAGGNGNIYGNMGTDLDQYSPGGKKILDPKSAYFKDSGAVLVAASSRQSPHTRSGFSNYGNRINCFACGESILTAGNHPGLSGYAINTYTEKFGGTSGAAAIIAGAAIAIQSIEETNRHMRLNPAQMRQYLSDKSLGTPSANGRDIDKIGMMPDLKKIIDRAIGIKPANKIRSKLGIES